MISMKMLMLLDHDVYTDSDNVLNDVPYDVVDDDDNDDDDSTEASR